MINFLRTLIFQTKYTILYDVERQDSKVGNMYFDEALKSETNTSEDTDRLQQPKTSWQTEFYEPKL